MDEVAKYKNVLSIQEYTHWKYVEGRLFVYEGDINLANAAFSKAIQLCEVYPQKDLLLIQRAALHRNNGFIFCNAQQIFLICWVYILVTPSCQQLIFCKKVCMKIDKSTATCKINFNLLHIFKIEIPFIIIMFNTTFEGNFRIYFS